MNQDELKLLTAKIVEGTASNEELRLYSSYLSYLDKANEGDNLNPSDKESLKLLLKGKIDQQIKLQVEEQLPNPYLKYRNIAAAIVLLCSLAFGYLYIHQFDYRRNTVTPIQLSAVTDTPEIKKVTLTLSNGSRILLDDADNGTIALQGDMEVVKTENGQLKYSARETSTSTKQPLYNTISTPRGVQYRVVLPDGSTAWLNAASSITYPIAFNVNERAVSVSGEVYFVISPNQKSPFTVQTAEQKIHVLGTQFNVKAYPEGSTTTTLLQGSVRVSANKTNSTENNGEGKILRVGEKAVSVNSGLDVQEADIEEVLAWREGFFKFQNNLQDIMLQIARWYDVDITYKVTAKRHLAFGGKISRSRSLKEVLSLIEETGNVHFEIKERRVTVLD